jgi:hypothetical protein
MGLHTYRSSDKQSKTDTKRNASTAKHPLQFQTLWRGKNKKHKRVLSRHLFSHDFPALSRRWILSPAFEQNLVTLLSRYETSNDRTEDILQLIPNCSHAHNPKDPFRRNENNLSHICANLPPRIPPQGGLCQRGATHCRNSVVLQLHLQDLG